MHFCTLLTVFATAVGLVFLRNSKYTNKRRMLTMAFSLKAEEHSGFAEMRFAILSAVCLDFRSI